MHLSLVYIDRAVELLVVSSGTSYVQQLHVCHTLLQCLAGIFLFLKFACCSLQL